MADYANVIFSLSEPDQPRLLKSPIEGDLVTGVGIDIQADASETSDATILRIKAKGSNWGATAKALHIDTSEGYAIAMQIDTSEGTILKITQDNIYVYCHAKYSNLVAIRVDKGDYGGNFTNYTPPADAVEGDMLFAVDTNATNPGQRLYAYLNGAWHYVDLT